MKIRASVFALMVALVPLVSSENAALAQGGGKDAVTDMARQRFQEGVRLFDAGKFEEARAAFVQAYALKKHPAVLLNLAQSEVKSNHSVEAARHFVQFLRENPSASANERTAAEKGLADARRKTARLAVSVNLEGADVLVDDEVVGRAPLADAVDVAMGARKVEARLAGHPAVVVQVSATVGKETPVSLQFPPSGTGASPVAPAASSAVPSRAASSASPVSQPTSTAQPQADGGGFFGWVAHDPVAWATLGVTAIGLAGGTVFSLKANANANNADSYASQIRAAAAVDSELDKSRKSNVCATPIPTGKVDYSPSCGKLQDELDARDSNRTMAIVGWSIFGAGAIGTTVAYFIRGDKHSGKSASTTQFTPVASHNLTGLVVSGSF